MCELRGRATERRLSSSMVSGVVLQCWEGVRFGEIRHKNGQNTRRNGQKFTYFTVKRVKSIVLSLLQSLTYFRISVFPTDSVFSEPPLNKQPHNLPTMTFAAVLTRRATRSLLTKRTLSTPAATTNSPPAASAKALSIAQFDSEYLQNKAHLEEQKSEIQKYREQITAIDPHAVFAVTTPLPDPVLPDNKAEVAALDPAYMNQIPLNPDGSEKWVVIKQEQAKWPGQAPLNKESQWVISFQDLGETAETWNNPLMGWVSSADPMANNMRLQMSFDTAEDAKYFAEKRGWKFLIEPPIIRKGRDDDAQYQDVFLPQSVAGDVKRNGKKCDQWYRDAAGASHYFRPLKYHGDGVVRQHGLDREAEIAKDAESYYKMR